MAISVDGIDALHRLKSTDPPLYLSPSPDLSQAARLASQNLFASLKPFTPKSPFDRLIVDGFDAEQIWQQIDLQTQPLISTLRREVKKLEKNPEQLLKLFGEVGAGKQDKVDKAKTVEKFDDGVEDEDLDDDLDLEDFNEEEEEEEESDNEGEEDEGNRGNEGEDGIGVEDKFLKINELQEYLEDDEAKEYGSTKKKIVKRDSNEDGDDDEDGEDDDDDEFGLEDDDEEDEEDARYEDFFGDKKKDKSRRPYSANKVDNKLDKKRRPKWIREVNDSDAGDEKDNVMTGRKSKPVEGSDGSDPSDEEADEIDADNQKNETLSTHEKNLQKQRSKIEEMEKANMEPKTWTMQGEVTAAKRPKDSALEVVLDYQRNVKAAPVITEEVTESLEDLIQKRISEGNFDDIHRAPSLPSKAPREVKELDENKSKKGLGEIYADEYVQKTGLVSAALSFSDEQKKEASVVFKRLCLKLDALSHFHFTPKPVIEDMSIQVNVPALAMEEIAPLAVSDAAMLAPEEVFTGKGDIKEEAELTQAERRRRRANKKRKFKAKTANKMVAKKARESMLSNGDAKEE